MGITRRQLVAMLPALAAVGAPILGPFPLAAEPAGRVFAIGFLEVGAGTDPAIRQVRDAFARQFAALGYAEGGNLRLVERYADGDLTRLPGLAADLVRAGAEVLVVAGDASIVAARRAADGKIPIVMSLSPDPVGSGFVASLAHPGGNITGLSAIAPELASKRLELLTEIVPHASRIDILWNSTNKPKLTEWCNTAEAAKVLHVTPRSFEARASGEFDQAFAAIAHDRGDALLAFNESLYIALRERIWAFALANRLPMMSEAREFAEAGGLITYGVSRVDLRRRAAIYVDKILRGAKPAELPVEQPTKFELMVNLKTARAIGLKVPESFLARADEVIE